LISPFSLRFIKHKRNVFVSPQKKEDRNRNRRQAKTHESQNNGAIRNQFKHLPVTVIVVTIGTIMGGTNDDWEATLLTLVDGFTWWSRHNSVAPPH
jgi:Na+/glutamate symporter